MPSLTRRSFLKTSALTAGTGLVASSLRPSVHAAPAGANDAIRMAIIGLGNKGRQHLKILSGRKDVRVVAICDVDPQAAARAAQELKSSPAPFVTNDAREIMARQDVDAVVVVASNHWHALMAVWGCQAGKDVYVEKPMTHTVWEGRQLIAAAKKYNRIVQVGTQYRSEIGLAEGIKFIHAGELGKLQYVHAVYYGARGSIGRKAPWYPTELNYDMYCGPTPVVPLERDRLHYDWHWSWNTGNGEIGNNGVHLLDIALRMVGSPIPPKRILSLGGRFVYDDVADTPNAQIAVYDFPDTPIIYESRALSAKPGVTYMDQTSGVRGVGVVAHCEGGYLSGLVGCAAYDKAGKIIRNFKGDGGGTHMSNFLDAVRSRRSETLAAPVTAGHASASMCHYGNISLRVGRPADPTEIAKSLAAIPAAAEVNRSLQAHLAVHGIDLAKKRLTLGEWIQIDPAADKVTAVESGNEAALARAQYLIHEVQRPPFVIPEQV